MSKSSIKKQNDMKAKSRMEAEEVKVDAVEVAGESTETGEGDGKKTLKKPNRCKVFTDFLKGLLAEVLEDPTAKVAIEMVIEKSTELKLFKVKGAKVPNGGLKGMGLDDLQIGFLIVTPVADLAEIEGIDESVLDKIAEIMAEKEWDASKTKLKRIAGRLGKDNVLKLWAAYVDHVSKKYAVKM